MSQFEQLETRRLLAAQHPVGINFNDEALWDVNFNTAVAEAKKLGVTSVRLWLGIDSYTARPNVWDPEPTYAEGTAMYGGGFTVSDAMVMRRAFELDAHGFSVMIALVPGDGAAPASASQLTSLVNHYKNATQTPTSTRTLAQAVDMWEVGNEPDMYHFWAESSPDKNVGIKSFVDKFLSPAAQVLHNAGETVVSGGPAWSSNDLNTLLAQVKLRNAMSMIDYVGYHPYGSFDPDTSANEQRDRTLAAKAVADKYGKQMIATEWNVRGYSPTGDAASMAKWARAMDLNYRNVVLPNFHSVYYFALVNNWPLRKGNTSARPASVLKHNSTQTDLSGQSTANKEAYLKSALIRNDPFYTTFNEWQYGNISGVVSNGGSTASLAGRTVFVDTNGNGAFDSTEPSAQTSTTGAYTLKYSSRQVSPGTYNVRVVIPSGWQSAAPSKSLSLINLKTTTGANFTLSPMAPPPITTGSLAGKAWNDADADSIEDSGESALADRTVYIDLDNDSQKDVNEPSAVTSALGAFTINYDTTTTPAGSYKLRQVLPSGWEPTLAPTVTVGANRNDTNVKTGSRPVVTTGSLAGKAWNDEDGDDTQDAGEADLVGRTVYVDLDNDSQHDLNEPSAVTSSLGAFLINYDINTAPAGSYTLRQVLASDWESTFAPTVTLAAARNDTNIKSGSRLIVTTGSLAGNAWDDADADTTIDSGEANLVGRTVYIDVDNDGELDVGEPSAVTDDSGAFKIDYDTTTTLAGSYRLRQVLSSEWESTFAPTVTVAGRRNDTNIRSGSRLIPPPPTTGSFAGRLWHDSDADGTIDSGEGNIGSRLVFIDLDGNSTHDVGEPSATTASNGTFTIDYDTVVFAPGDYPLLQALPAGWEQTTSPVTVTLAAGRADQGASIGSRVTPVAGTVVGAVWDDSDADRTVNGSEGPLANRVVFLDLNNNGAADSAEPSATTASDGTFTISYLLTPGTSAGLKLAAVTNWETTTLPQSLTLSGGEQSGLAVGTRFVAPPPPITTGSVSGWTWQDIDADGVIDAAETMLTNRVVFIDIDGDGALDVNEPKATSGGAQGAFKIDYDVAVTPAGTYALRQVLPTGWEQTTPIVNVTIAGNSADPGYEVGSRLKQADPKTASISGFLWNDTDADGVVDVGEGRTGARVAFLDTNGNARLDSGEKSMTTDSQGNFKFTGLAAGTYHVTRVFPTGYRLSNGANGVITVNLGAGQALTGVAVGTTSKPATTTPPPPPPPTGTDPKTASIGGFLWNDTDGDGVVDSGESRTASRVVFIDTNGNKTLDSGEKSTTSDSSGNYKFTGLAAGTYRVTRVFPSGYRLSNNSTGYLTVTVAAAQAVTGVNLGTTNKV